MGLSGSEVEVPSALWESQINHKLTREWEIPLSQKQKHLEEIGPSSAQYVQIVHTAKELGSRAC